MKKEIVDFLTTLEGYSDFNKKELTILAGFMELKAYRKGEIIFAEGSMGEEFYIVKDGIVGIWKKSYLGDRILSKVFKGEIFGEMAVLEGMPRSATAKADEMCQILCFKKSDFINIKNQHPEIAIKLMDVIFRIISRRLRETTSRFL